MFGLLSSRASATSSGRVTCTVPASDIEGSVPVSAVTSKGISVSLGDSYYLYTSLSNVTSFAPTAVSEFGGALLTLSGDFSNTDGFSCVLSMVNKSSVYIPALFVASDTARCELPRLEPGLWTVFASGNGGSDVGTPAYARLLVELAATIVSVVPSVLAPSGTTVIIHALNVGPGTVSCRLQGALDYPATRLVSTDARVALLACSLPSVEVIGAVLETPLRLDIVASADGSIFTSPAGAGSVSYRTQPTLVQVTPFFIPAGRSALLLQGADFVRNATLCRFDAAPATTILTIVTESGSRATCLLPSFSLQTGLKSAVSVSVDGGSSWFTTSIAALGEVEMTAAIHVSAVSPSVVAASVGTREAVVISGSGFKNITSLVCRIGDVIARATFLNEHEVICPLPEFGLSAASHPLSVALSRTSFLEPSEGDIMLFAVDAPIPTIALPALVPAEGGITLVLRGTNLAATALLSMDLRCVFSFPTQPQVPSISASAERDKESKVTCRVPPMPRFFSAPLPALVALNYGHGAITTSPLQVTFVHLQQSRAVVMPPAGPARGGSRIIVSSLLLPALTNTSSIRCIFAGNRSVALAVELRQASIDSLADAVVTCISPTGEEGTQVRVAIEIEHDWLIPVGSFVFEPLPFVSVTSPSDFSERGGELVSLLGTGFSPSLLAICRWASSASLQVTATTPARVVDASHAECTTPAPLRAGRIALSLSSNGVDFSDAIFLTSYAAPDVFSTSPAFGSVAGGAIVTVNGRGFRYTPTLSCFFGEAASLAQFVSREAIICSAPPSSVESVDGVGAVSFSVGDAKGLRTSPPLTFAYHEPPRVDGLSPPEGTFEGGTSIVLTGIHLETERGAFLCRFGDAIVAASVTGVSTCVSPILSLFDAVRDTFSVPLSISVNGGAEWIETGLFFTYTRAALTSALSPEFIAEDATDGSITVMGQGFIDSVGLVCRFAPAAGPSKIAVAYFVSASRVQCAVPPLPFGPTVVQVSVNKGLQWMKHSLILQVVSRPRLLSASPYVVHASGGTVISIVGGGFYFSSYLRCLFNADSSTTGWVQVDAIFVSSQLVECVSPPFSGLSVAQQRLNVPVRVTVLNSPVTLGDIATAVTPLVLRLVPLPDAIAVDHRALTIGTPRDVVVSGQFLSSVTLCSFGTVDVTAPARVLNDSAIVCTAPSGAEGTVIIRVSANGQQYSLGDAAPRITYTPVPVITGFSPEIGPEIGGTRVRIVGEFFADTATQAAPFSSPLALCRFGRLPQTPAIISGGGSVATCTTPIIDLALEPNSFDGVKLAVSIDGGVSWHYSTQSYGYYRFPTILSVSPRSGPSSGGTIVIVTGTNFALTSRLSCRFGKQDVAAAFLNSSAIRCICPIQRSTSIAIGVSLNGLDFSVTNGTVFDFYAPPAPIRAMPPSAPILVSTNITILGRNFFGPFVAGALRVKFDEIPSSASGFLNASAIWTLTPPSTVLTPFSPLIRVSFNGGVDWSTSSLHFNFLATESIVGISPVEVAEDTAVDIYVTGINFVSSEAFACRFTHVVGSSTLGRVDVVTPQWISAPAGVVCRLPPSAKGRVTVEVSNNGVTWSPRGPLVSIIPRIAIYTIDPTAGPLNGGSVISLFVHGLASRAVSQQNLMCRFNRTVSVPALIVSPHVVECITPVATKSGAVLVELSTDGGASFVSTLAHFSFVPSPAISRVAPSLIIRSTATPLVLYGEGFYNATAFELTSDSLWPFPTESRPVPSNAECVFTIGMDSWSMPAVILNSSALSCTSPALDDSTVSLAVNMEGQHVSFATLTLRAADAVSLLRVRPSIVSERGGMRVRVTGSHFEQHPTLACTFSPLLQMGTSANSMPALFVSSTEIDCAVPSMVPGAYKVSIVLNGLHFSTGLLVLNVISAPVVNSITPLKIAAEGATLMTIHGDGFVRSAYLACLFANVRVPATFVNRSQVQCLAPPWMGRVNATGSECVVEVSVGPSDATDSGRSISYHASAFVSALTPTSGPHSGGTRVTLYGKGFTTAGSVVSCLFTFGGNIKTLAACVASVENNTVVCVVPPLLPLNAMRPAFSTDIGVRAAVSPVVDGVISTSSVDFIYFGDLELFSVEPARGPTTGGTIVTITGAIFPRAAQLVCIARKAGSSRDSTAVTAAWLSPSAVACALTAFTAHGSYFLSVSTNGVDFANDLEFFVDEPTQILSIEPAEGPVRGGTVVTIYGNHFAPSPRLACSFGTAGLAIVDAVFVNTTTVRCLTPIASEPGAATVSITLNGADFTPVRVPFIYTPAPNVTMITPFSGPSTGETVVTISGSGFIRKTFAMAKCRFGVREVPAILVNNSYITCVSPAVALNVVLDSELLFRNPFGAIRSSLVLDVALNGFDFEPVGDFFYYTPPVVSLLSPSSGPSGGGTALHVQGWGLSLGSGTRCIFRLNTTQAADLTTQALSLGANRGIEGGTNSSFSTDLTALSTAQMRRSSDFVFLTAPALVTSASSVECILPPQPADTLPVALVGISGNGVQYDFDTLSVASSTFTYDAPLAVSSIEPASGSFAEHTRVRVTGSGFGSPHALSCRFGFTIVPALVVSDTIADCIAPAREKRSFIESSTTRLVVDVTGNGIDFTSSGIFFSYVAPLSFVIPTGVDGRALPAQLTGSSLATGVFYLRFLTPVMAAEPLAAARLLAAPANTVVVSVTELPDVSKMNVACRVGARTGRVTFVDATGDYVCDVPDALDASEGAVSSEALLSVSVDGGFNWRATTLVYEYLPAPSVSAVIPMSLSLTDASDILVVGGGFVNSVGLQCRWTFDEDEAVNFDGTSAAVTDITVNATWLMPTELRCTPPRLVRLLRANLGPVLAVLEVSNNFGIEWSSSGAYFEFVDAPVLSAISPTLGPRNGGTLLILYGSGFAAAPPGLVRCVFGKVKTAASRIISDSAIECIVPPSRGSPWLQTVEVVTVRVSLNDATLSLSSLSFVYHPLIIVSSVSPSRGPVNGGSRVVLRGSGFRRAPAAGTTDWALTDDSAGRCRFGSVVVGGEILSDDAIQCESPALSLSTTELVALQVSGRAAVALEVSLNGGVDWSASGAGFTFTPPLRVTGVQPSLGAASGGTLLAVSGSGFLPSADLACDFSGERTVANYISMERVTCRTPSWPRSVTSTVPLRMLVNGADKASESNVSYTFIPDVSVSRVFPSRALWTGQTIVFVSGSNFLVSGGLSCRFDDTIVPAIFVSSSLISCVVPPRVSIGTLSASGVRVHVSLNGGADWTSSWASFSYLGACPSGSYCPTWDILPCPNGTACWGEGNFNFTPCAQGTFQPRAEQSSCFPCPIGFICSDIGLSAPVLCPAGSVCDRPGLAAPAQPCPPGHWCPSGTKTADPLDFVGVRRADAYLLSERRLANGLFLAADDDWGVEDGSGLLFDSSRELTWRAIPRLFPASSSFILNVPPVGTVSRLSGGPRVPAPALYAERPRPCPLGTYCRAGVATNISEYRNFSTPQSCFGGYFCPRGSASPQGSGPCPTGFYCPTHSDAYICPTGAMCPDVANAKPRPCIPGTYNPLRQQGNCSLCPPGHVCPRWGMREPELCPAGFVCNEFGLPQPAVVCPSGYMCAKGTATEDISGSLVDDPNAPPYAYPFNIIKPPYLYKISRSVAYGSKGLRGRVLHTGETPGTFLDDPEHDLYSPDEIGNKARYREPWLNGTADPDATQLRRLILDSLASGPEAPSYAYIASKAALRPVACLPGTFCLGGVRSHQVVESVPAQQEGLLQAQSCPPGAYCRFGASTSMGTGPCFPGHYCPPGSVYPIKVPRGNFAQGKGSVAPILCLPGTFAPFIATNKCEACPAGYSCNTYGSYIPNICPVGHYRSLVDSVSCRMCPIGTYSPRVGLADITDCDICPAGRICATEGMYNMSLSQPCPEGHVCGEGTSGTHQFDAPCPGGYYCGLGQSPEQALDNQCPAGSICAKGTKLSQHVSIQCAGGSFCPNGTPTALNEETRCPLGTSSKSGAKSLKQCSIQTVLTCAKNENKHYTKELKYHFFDEVLSIGGAGEELAVLRPTDPINVTGSSPYWVNDTLDPRNIHPESGALQSEGDKYTIFGYNFDGAERTFCQWTLLNVTMVDKQKNQIPFLVNEGKVVSPFSMQCSLPLIRLQTTGEGPYTMALEVGRLGGEFTRKKLTIDLLVIQPPPAPRLPNITEIDRLLKEKTEAAPAEIRFFFVPALNWASIQMDFSHIPKEVVYSEHWEVAIYVAPSYCANPRCRNFSDSELSEELTVNTGLFSSPCAYPVPFSGWFKETPNKNQMLNFTLFALEDVLFYIEVHILYGLYLPISYLFKNSTIVTVSGPVRAYNYIGQSSPPLRNIDNTSPLPFTHQVVSTTGRRIKKAYTMVTLFYKTTLEEVATPLNLPLRFKETETGRVLLSFNVSSEQLSDPKKGTPLQFDAFETVHFGPVYWQPPLSLGLIKATQDYREIFQADITGASYEFNTIVLPYIPYLSNCYGFDSYVYWQALLEDERNCGYSEYTKLGPASRYDFPPLPHIDQVQPVGPYDLGLPVIADVCKQTISCNFEEALSQSDNNPRWFEKGTGTEIFRISRNAYSDVEWAQQTLTTNMQILQETGDVEVRCLVDRTAADDLTGSCTVFCYPRAVVLEMYYIQLTKESKRILSAQWVLSQFDRDATKTNYAFTIDYYPMEYTDLLFKFAFDDNFYNFLFILIGVVLVCVALALWVLHRGVALVRYGILPPMNLLGFLSLVVVPILTGSLLVFCPIILILYAVAFVLKAPKILPDFAPPGAPWLLDVLSSKYTLVVIDPMTIDSTQYGRIGVSFLVIGCVLLVFATNLLIPHTVSKREQILEQTNNVRLRSKNTWVPTTWRRLHFMYISFLYIFTLLFFVYFSYWTGFGDNIYLIISMYKVINIIFEEMLKSVLRDVSLVVPLSIVMSVVQTLVTLGANDFKGFLISWSIDTAMAYGESLYVSKNIGNVIEYFNKKYEFNAARYKLWRSKQRKLTPQEQLEQEEHEAAEAKQVAESAAVRAAQAQAELDALPAAAKAAMYFDKKNKESKSGATESVVEQIQGYGVDGITLTLVIVVIFLNILFRDEIGIAAAYSIKYRDMNLYLYFQVIITLPQYVFDMFMINSFEAIYNLKVYEYLVYARYRFLRRSRRWIHMETRLDECIQEEFRTADQSCFSSQYYVIQLLASVGMSFCLFAVMIIDNASLNLFNDPGFVPVTLITLLILFIVGIFCQRLANYTKLWKVKGDENIWHSSMGEGIDMLYSIPGQGDLLRNHKSSLTAIENNIMNQRMSSETFRKKFVDYNRLWLVENLPLVLTPRTLRRSRPYLISQLAKILKASSTSMPTDENAKFGDLSSILGDANLNASCKALVRWWFAKAQRNLRFVDLTKPLIAKAKKLVCEQCDRTRPPMEVELMIPTETLASRFEVENAADESFDSAKWKVFFLRYQRFRTICRKCKASRVAKTGEDLKQLITEKVTTMSNANLGGIDAGTVSREIAEAWLDKARDRLVGFKEAGPNAVALPFGVLNLAQDLKSEELEARGRHAKIPMEARQVNVTLVSKMVALTWLSNARSKLAAPLR